MDFRYKKCAESDLDILIHISRTTFQNAFQNDNNPKDFKQYLEEAFAKEKLVSELSNPNSVFCFVYVDDVLSGYFKLNENSAQTDIKSKESLEIERIYVKQEFQGKGIGQNMLEKIKQIAFKKQKMFIWLGVWEKNKRAIDFYRRHGFFEFGTHPYFIGNDKQTDWLMRFDLINLNPE
ncbi:GNAT family N-acetyltransferase [Costertonia aggregata]|uniref:GNAT family N-acetyltransferase n=1 Tax=Costertonia aggregata TaxID=343403 RepID=A0A7H9AQ00_9FLAO|nr:GNAT family N-acetyltransferase [Costertonia aggregata]QLG45325.1 GNAT family N-acetyltransferase [Costertonia aggregata]